MKNFYTLALTILSALSINFTNAQTGPNLLGAKGTFSAPFITVNSHATNCTRSGSTSYNPVGNIGNALNGCSSSGSSLPCSGYNYVYKSDGLGPEFTYSIIKNIGDANGGNCIKGDWRGQDHTGDGGYFMAVNGAPNNTYSNLFYQIKSIPFARVLNMNFLRGFLMRFRLQVLTQSPVQNQTFLLKSLLLQAHKR